MFQKIRSLFNRKNKDEIQTRYEEITAQNNQLLNRLLSEDKELIKKYNMQEDNTMMYSEFIELSGKTEKYISFAEYTTFIEPIYMDSNCTTKQDFISMLNEVFEKIVYPAVEKAIHNLSLNDKLSIIECNSATVTEKIEKVDFEARKIAYEYLKLYTKL